MAARFRRLPAGGRTGPPSWADECSFDLPLVAPQLPDWDTPAGHTEMSWLRELTLDGAVERYGPPGAGARARGVQAARRTSCDVIEQLDFPGYFLIV